MVFNRYLVRITVRLGLIFSAMLTLVLFIGQQGKLFSILIVALVLLLLIVELFHKISRTNRIVESLLESIRYGDFNKKIYEKATGMGFEGLAESAQKIIRAIASAKIEKETQYQYLQTILDHIHTAVITMDDQNRTELINPLALNTLGLYNTRKPTWQEIEKMALPFAETVTALGESGRQMIQLSNTPTGKKLLILVTTVKIGGKPVKIITFQDIEPEIEQKEIESWQTISRIMAHEIMNSLTPLSSLTETGIMLLEENGHPRAQKDLTQQTIDNLYTALKTISDRNRALTQFINNYRQLSRLPLPDKKEIRVSELLQEIQLLYENQCADKGIRLSVSPGSGKNMIRADEAQVKQVLINLIKNATEAMVAVSNPLLGISVKRILNSIAIEITDNGTGIPTDIMDRIFVPFFSTKSDGSGIGLSLSRQIIRNHGGQMAVESEEGKGTTFRVTFPAE